MPGYDGRDINSFIPHPISNPSKDRIIMSFGYDFSKKSNGCETINIMDEPIIGPNKGKLKEITLQKYYLESLRSSGKTITQIGKILQGMINA